MPIHALCLVAAVCCLLSIISTPSTRWDYVNCRENANSPFIDIGSATAFNALISLPLTSLYISYCIPILFLLIRKLRNRTLALGPFNLGRYGIAVNAIAVAYILYVSSFVALPTIMPVTAANMDYAGPLTLAVALIAVGDWVASGRRRFKLPEVPVVY